MSVPNSQKYCAALQYNSLEVLKLMEMCVEKLGGIVNFPMSLFSEKQFQHLTADEKMQMFAQFLEGKWRKPHKEGSPGALHKGISAFILTFN